MELLVLENKSLNDVICVMQRQLESTCSELVELRRQYEDQITSISILDNELSRLRQDNEDLKRQINKQIADEKINKLSTDNDFLELRNKMLEEAYEKLVAKNRALKDENNKLESR